MPSPSRERILILGLGSNVGRREEYLRQAIEELRPFLKEMRVSAIHETPAVLAPGAPPEWDVPFLNMAVAGHCSLTPKQVLSRAKAIEKSLGRVDRGFWSPREIDVDILAYGDIVLESEALTIPHHLLLHRAFALRPLAEVAPGWTWPVEGELFGKTASELAAAL